MYTLMVVAVYGLTLQNPKIAVTYPPGVYATSGACGVAKAAAETVNSSYAPTVMKLVATCVPAS